MNIIPIIGSKGLWKTITPYDTKVSSTRIYECIAIRSISDIINSGLSPEEEYYTILSITTVKYLLDVSTGVVILTLRSDTGELVYIPNTYIIGLPDAGGIPYRVLGLLVNLGALPTNIDLSIIQTRLNSLVLEMLGVSATTEVVTLSPEELLPIADSLAIEAARVHMISAAVTDYSLYMKTLTEREALSVKNTILEDYIKMHHIP